MVVIGRWNFVRLGTCWWTFWISAVGRSLHESLLTLKPYISMRPFFWTHTLPPGPWGDHPLSLPRLPRLPPSASAISISSICGALDSRLKSSADLSTAFLHFHTCCHKQSGADCDNMYGGGDCTAGWAGS